MTILKDLKIIMQHLHVDERHMVCIWDALWEFEQLLAQSRRY